MQDARQMINSRKQGQSQSSVPAQTTLKAAIAQQLQTKTLVPQIQIHNNNNLGGVNTRQFAPNLQGLSARGSTTTQLSNNGKMMDARDRLSLKRSIGGALTQAAAAPPLKITKTIQVSFTVVRSVIQPVHTIFWSVKTFDKLLMNTAHPYSNVQSVEYVQLHRYSCFSLRTYSRIV